LVALLHALIRPNHQHIEVQNQTTTKNAFTSKKGKSKNKKKKIHIMAQQKNTIPSH
jgi:hypothetical protein